MKLRTRLLISYLLVMILPLVAAYILFASISAFNNEQELEKYLFNANELQELIDVLDEPNLYHPNQAQAIVDAYSNPSRFITIYNQTGIVLYSSNPVKGMTQLSVNKSTLYKNLYKMEQGYRVNEYKQPVFSGAEIVGFFQIETAREEWTKGVEWRGYVTLGIFIVVFLLIYLSIILFVNRKFTSRLTGLMGEMTAFASGKQLQETATNKDEIGQLQDRFYAMCRQITAAQETIVEEQKMKEYMVATISHDLKTPLTSIKAYTEALSNESGLPAEERAEYEKIVMEKADFMQVMLDDLLTYTVLQSSERELALVEVEGDEFFDMLISDYEALGVHKSILIHTFAEVGGSYQVNPKQMIRVIDNLVTNAVQHTDTGDQIWITAFSEKRNQPAFLFDFVDETLAFDFEKYTYIIVQNQGAGIAVDQLGKILEPLYQVDEARSKRGDYGTGLGLSITKQIIEKHGGSVQVLSKEDIGTAVICLLPKQEG